MKAKALALVVAFVLMSVLVLALAVSPAAAQTGGTVTLQSTSSGQSLSCSPGSCTFGTPTVAGTDTLITSYAALAGQTGSVAVYLTSPVCGVTSLTTLANFTISGASAFSRIYLFYGVGFAAGATSCGATVVGGSGVIWIFATQAWSNVSQSSPIAQNAQATGTTQTNYTASVTNTPASHDLMADWDLAMAGTITIPSPGAAQVSQWTKTIAAAIYGRGSTKPTSAVIPKTMYNTVTSANAAWGQFVVDIGSDFVATPPATPATRTGTGGSSYGGYVWGNPGQWANGTFVNTLVVGNCLQLVNGATSGTWTSNVLNQSAFITDINLTYSGSTVTRYVSGLAVLQWPQSVPMWSANTFFWGGTQYNQNVGHLQASQWQVRISLAGDGSGTPSVCGMGVAFTGSGYSPPPDWTIYLIIILVLLVIALVGWVVVHVL